MIEKRKLFNVIILETGSATEEFKELFNILPFLILLLSIYGSIALCWILAAFSVS
jgi:hypothetical protein